MPKRERIPKLGTDHVKPISFSGVKGKVVIVTGASRGIGEAIAKLYGAHEMKVVCAERYGPICGFQTCRCGHD